MGRPRLLILVRHGQSEGNKNRDIHQYIPDHRVKLTPDGWAQAEDAGKRLKGLLRKDDTIRIFTSPYRRTRETTEGILRTLTGPDESGPSPFQRDDITVYEEPRLREQDFGNFQPCSIEMERMWQERADYGHFFYRIPNGESAADAYDRISGFNESLWRQFAEEDFPSVCVLVTHGLMTRVFLMKWYHWSVEYFEDLRNIHHCEFIKMARDENNKYTLQTTLRTWSELHARSNGATEAKPDTHSEPHRRWGGCSMGCNHHKMVFPRKTRRTSTMDIAKDAPADAEDGHDTGEEQAPVSSPLRSKSVKRFTSSTILHEYEMAGHGKKSIVDGPIEGSSADDEPNEDGITMAHHHRLQGHLHGRDGGGSTSGIGSPVETDDSDYFEAMRAKKARPGRSSLAQVMEENGNRTRSRSERRRRKAEEGKAEENGEEMKPNDEDLERAIAKGELDPEEGTAKGDIY